MNNTKNIDTRFAYELWTIKEIIRNMFPQAN